LRIHRITHINQDGSVIAWGDFNLQPDPTVMPEQIIGIAKTIKRKDQQIPIRSCRKVWGQTVIQLRPLLILSAKIVRKLIWLIKIKKRVNHEN